MSKHGTGQSEHGTIEAHNGSETRKRDLQCQYGVRRAVMAAMAGALRRSFARADIAQVTSGSTPSRAGGYGLTAVGLLVGFEMGAGIALGCTSHCSAGQKTQEALAMVGLPVGLGFAGYYGLRHPGEVIYRAP